MNSCIVVNSNNTLFTTDIIISSNLNVSNVVNLQSSVNVVGQLTVSNAINIIDTTNNIFNLTEYNDTDGAVIRGKRAKGTVAAPTSLLSGDCITGLRAIGYNGSAFSGRIAAINIFASSNYSVGNTGTYINFETSASNASSSLERMRITDAGNVGIGTSAPLAKLSILGDGTYPALALDGVARDIGYAGNLQIGTWDGSTWSEKVRIDSVGNVGIGTSTPGYALDVVNDIRATGEIISTQNNAGKAYGFIKTIASASTLWYKLATVTEGQIKASFNICGTVNYVHDFHKIDVSVTMDNNSTGIYSTIQHNTAYYAQGTNIWSYMDFVVVTETSTKTHLYMKVAPPAAAMSVAFDITATSKNISGSTPVVFYPNTSFTLAFAGTMNSTIDTSLTGTLTPYIVSTNANTKYLRLMDQNGNVGIGTSTPNASYKLDVNGAIITNNNNINAGTGTISATTLTGNHTGTVSATTGTFSGRLTASSGIAVLNTVDNNWAIYMAVSGASKSYSGGTAIASPNFSADALRFRVANAASQGFIFENSSEQCLVSIQGSTGNTTILGTLGVTGLLTASGGINATGTVSVYNATTLSSVAVGTSNLLFMANNNVNNNSQLNILDYRHTAGADWTGVGTKIQKRIDITNQTYIEFNPPNGNYALAFGNGGTEYMRIVNGGNVGIGTSNPASKLDVAGTIRSSASANGGYISYDNTPTHLNSLTRNGNYASLSSYDGHYFYVNSTTGPSTGTLAMTILNSGNIGIGTASPTSLLHVSGGNIVCSGNITGTEVYATSDIRKKKDFEPIVNSEDIINKLNGSYFKLKNDETNKRKIGLIAQEVREVLPEVVDETADGFLTISYGPLVALLIENAKQQNEEIRLLKEEIKLLKQEMKS